MSAPWGEPEPPEKPSAEAGSGGKPGGKPGVIALLGCSGLVLLVGAISGLVSPPHSGDAAVAASPSPPTATSSASPSPGVPAATLAQAASYLYATDQHGRTLAAETALLTRLTRPCNDDPLVLSRAAEGTALAVTRARRGSRPQDGYAVLLRLAADVSKSAPGLCAPRLPLVQHQLTPAPTTHPTARPTARPKR
ncbi:hypothetical protein ABIA32_003002 [Streptacidiphilus sp. MAP12-20]|uniref:hypothetical protein n=1 Tax=Streptacidiphilus sp. MAP12-20 TaxID=3156299 RepID=UPI003512F097